MFTVCTHVHNVSVTSRAVAEFAVLHVAVALFIMYTHVHNVSGTLRAVAEFAVLKAAVAEFAVLGFFVWQVAMCTHVLHM